MKEMIGNKKILGALVVAAVATSANAQAPFTTLKFDFNELAASLTSALASDGSSAGSYSGTLTLTKGGLGAFAKPVQGNNTGQYDPNNTFFPAGDPGTLSSVSATITFVSGFTTGVGFSFANAAGDSYSTTIKSGGFLVWDGFNYDVTGLTISGAFVDAGPDGLFGATGSSLVDVDISAFMAWQALGGTANGFFKDFNLAHSTLTDNVDMELIVAIPLPTGAALASFGMLGVFSRRRR